MNEYNVWFPNWDLADIYFVTLSSPEAPTFLQIETNNEKVGNSKTYN